jgi:hypothetical protein
MQKKLKIIPSKSPKDTLFRVMIVFTILAILFTIKEVAVMVIQGVQRVAPAFNPPVEYFQNVSANLAWLGIGVILIILAPLVAVVSLKWALFIIAGTAIAFSAWTVYKALFQGRQQNILPDEITRN